MSLTAGVVLALSLALAGLGWYAHQQRGQVGALAAQNAELTRKAAEWETAYWDLDGTWSRAMERAALALEAERRSEGELALRYTVVDRAAKEDPSLNACLDLTVPAALADELRRPFGP